MRQTYKFWLTDSIGPWVVAILVGCPIIFAIPALLGAHFSTEQYGYHISGIPQTYVEYMSAFGMCILLSYFFQWPYVGYIIFVTIVIKIVSKGKQLSKANKIGLLVGFIFLNLTYIPINFYFLGLGQGTIIYIGVWMISFVTGLTGFGLGYLIGRVIEHPRYPEYF